MHICKSPRRKIARKCIFCAGVPAYARIRAGAMALKSNSASYNFSAERSLMPGIALQYLRREPARREGACRSTKKNAHLQTFPKKNVRARAFCWFLTKNDRRNANKSRVNLLSICFCLRLALVSHSSRIIGKWQMKCVCNRKAQQRYDKNPISANFRFRKSQQNEILDASGWLCSQIEAIIHFGQPLSTIVNN